MPAAFDDVYSTSFSRIARSVRSIVGADAEDVANDAFAVAWSRWQEVGRYDMPDAWVRAVARRIAIARCRREAMRAERERCGAPAAATSDQPVDLDLGDALRRLPVAVRAAVALHYVEDRSIDDVAGALGTIAPTVKTWLHRARPRLAADVSGLSGVWVLDDPIPRTQLARRALEAGARDGLDAVMARMPPRRARWTLTIDDSRYLMANDDGEYFDDGRLRWVGETLRLRSTTAPDGEAIYSIALDGPVLSIGVGPSTMHDVDGVADAVFHTTMFDRVTLSWRGRGHLPGRIYRG